MCRLLVLLPFLTFCVKADTTPVISNVRILQHGLFLTSVEGAVPAPGTSSGEVSLMSKPRLIRTTSTIPAVQKSSFGIRYQIEGEPVGAPIAVRDVIITPGLKDPDEAGRVRYREVSRDITTIGKETFVGYTFDEAWEAVPGIWIVEVWHGDQQLVAQEFDVVKMKLSR